MDALINHLWQTTLFAAAIGLLALALRRNAARTRYWLWLAASLKFLVPFSLLFVAGRQAATRIEQPAMLKTVPVEVVEQVAFTFTPMPVEVATQRDWTGVLLAIWAIGTLIAVARWLVAWLRIRNAMRLAEPVDMDAPIPVLSTTAAIEPGIFGLFRPVLLLPRDIATKLSADELSAVLAHELCHLRYRDNLTAALHMAVSALFWFHPLVWWIGARLIEERERACDEHVLSQGNSREAYAQSILTVCKHYVASPVACASGVSGADLRKRIQAIMQHRVSRRLTVAHIALLSIAGLAVLAGPVCIGVLKGAIGADDLKFEVASIRPSAEEGDQRLAAFRDAAREQKGMHRHLPVRGRRLEARFYTPRLLIATAYRVWPHQIVGPDWLADRRFDVFATMPPGASVEQVPLMLQALLRERFGLRVSEGTREESGYALVVGKDGPKLERWLPPAQTGEGPPSPAQMGRMIEARMNEQEKRPPGEYSRWRTKGETMAGLAGTLSSTVQAYVVDQTGLEGKYNWDLEVLPPLNPEDRDLFPRVLDGLKKLGLDLKRERVTIQTIVVESALKEPTEN